MLTAKKYFDKKNFRMCSNLKKTQFIFSAVVESEEREIAQKHTVATFTRCLHTIFINSANPFMIFSFLNFL